MTTENPFRDMLNKQVPDHVRSTAFMKAVVQRGFERDPHPAGERVLANMDEVMNKNPEFASSAIQFLSETALRMVKSPNFEVLALITIGTENQYRIMMCFIASLMEEWMLIFSTPENGNPIYADKTGDDK